MIAESLVLHTEKTVTGFFQQYHKPELVYHNIAHTQEVVKVAEQIAAHYQLTDDDMCVIYVAAWFHDVGYLFGGPAEHEKISAEKAREFLKDEQADETIIKKVEGCILATKIPQSPSGLLEEIICDADLSHLGSDTFKEKSKVMRREKEILTGKEISGGEWRESTIRLMEAHHYFTTYCQALLKKGKQENLEELKKKQEKKNKDEAEKIAVSSFNTAMPVNGTVDKKKDKDEKKTKDDLPTRGIETMFRLTSSNHFDLSSMADSKANIMISVNSIIVSVLLSVLLRRLEEFPNLVIPTLLFLLVNVCTIIFAVLATRPNITKGTFTREDIHHKRANLLFFGNFHKMRLDDYEWGMKEMMRDKEFLYSSMIRDIYFLGAVLGRKYRLLRISYNIFMFGFIISVLAFAIAVAFFPVNN
jgi:predicted metal-dependent HD superfamily phosphohydrolase